MIDMACQFLDVTCIPRDLETIIRAKSHGVASWCEQLVKDMLFSNYIKVVSDKEIVIQEESEMPAESANLAETAPLPSSRPCTPAAPESNPKPFEVETYPSRPGSAMSRASFSGASSASRPLSALRRKSMSIVKTLTTLRRGSVAATTVEDGEFEEYRKQRRSKSAKLNKSFFIYLGTQPETRKLQQVFCRLVVLLSSSRCQDAFTSLAPAGSCQQAGCKLIIKIFCSQASFKLFKKLTASLYISSLIFAAS